MIRIVLALACLLGWGGNAHGQIATSLDPYEILRQVSRYYHVPAGALYGMWRKESTLLTQGWRTNGGDWFLARNLVAPGGLCFRKYSQEFCLRQWRALTVICHQARRHGSRVCDPNQVFTSYALAMGPTQHLPAELVEWKCPNQRCGWYWTADAVDADGDGLVDPNGLADALAMTAAQLLRYRSQAPDRSWRWAINRYYGSQRIGYYHGKWERAPSGAWRYRHGVHEHWIAWCKKFGCLPRPPSLAVR